jgi:hypothetical protein
MMVFYKLVIVGNIGICIVVTYTVGRSNSKIILNITLIISAREGKQFYDPSLQMECKMGKIPNPSERP